MQGNDNKQPRVREDGKAYKQRVASHEVGDKNLPRREGTDSPEAEKEIRTERDEESQIVEEEKPDVSTEDPQASKKEEHEDQREGAKVAQLDHTENDSTIGEDQKSPEDPSIDKSWDDLEVDETYRKAEKEQDTTDSEEDTAGSEEEQDKADSEEEQASTNQDDQVWEGRLDQDWGVPPAQPEPELEEDRPKPAGELKWKKDEVVSPVHQGEGDAEDPPNQDAVSQELKHRETEGDSTVSDLEIWTEPSARSEFNRRKLMKFAFVWLPVLSLGTLLGGVLIGYSVIGKGSVGDVFTMNLWEHLYKLVYG
ncbi:DNA-directed RNA polymerase subunit beta [Marininema mesophilum]|uniref:DNA-directed RNA polymerase subunit beta n=1 Tax=Marininema mesophilum TaxID=1048340 RepID=A0A1H2TF82_9BACL|nr:DNA-directed RNA polymerase subunit beta [Marininema mesophilum]SDW42345.1 DNA-directed RNA polymerase subunit beta [Marininema mesophilum]